MKKVLFMLALILSTGSIWAQKTTVKFQDTQARMLDVQTNAYVKPMTVELRMLNSGQRIKDVWPLTIEQVESMNGDIVNIRSYGVYMSSQKHNADVIVGATFNLRSEDTKEKGYILEVVGFPAEFINWKTATEPDYEWIKMEKTYTVSEREKIKAIVK